MLVTLECYVHVLNYGRYSSIIDVLEHKIKASC